MVKMNSINVIIENVDDAINKLNEASNEYQAVIESLTRLKGEMTPYWNGAAATAFFDKFEVLIAVLKQNKQCTDEMAKQAKKEKKLLEEIKLNDSFLWG